MMGNSNAAISVAAASSQEEPSRMIPRELMALEKSLHALDASVMNLTEGLVDCLKPGGAASDDGAKAAIVREVRSPAAESIIRLRQRIEMLTGMVNGVRARLDL